MLHSVGRMFDAVGDGSDFKLRFGIFRIQAASLSEHAEPLIRLPLHKENLSPHRQRDGHRMMSFDRDGRQYVGMLILPLTQQKTCVVGVSAGIVGLGGYITSEAVVGLSRISLRGLGAGLG